MTEHTHDWAQRISILAFSSVQFSPVTQSCPTSCNLMGCRMPRLHVYHQLLEFTQTHVHWLIQWYHPSISSSIIPVSSHPQSFPASGSLPMSQFFTSRGQIIRASALATVLPVNIQGWFPLGLTSLISLLSRGFSSLLQHHNSKASILQCSAFSMVQFTYLCMTTGKIGGFDFRGLC